MSWEAVTWATKQRMRSSHEQLVLLVLANAADPDGVAFARWPGRDHWWRYLVDLTRLSKSTLFRDINTLIDVGLCSRSMIVMADGSRRPTISLDLTANYKYEKNEEQNSHSHTGNEDAEVTDDSENISVIRDKQDALEGEEIHSHTGNEPENDAAIPTRGTDPFPVGGMQEDSLSCSKESPPTPQRGVSPVFDGDFEEFVKNWREPIPKMALARHAWDAIPTAKRGEVIAAARGYFAWLGKQTKPPPPVSAQSFLRDGTSWAQWLAYAPDPAGISASIVNSHALTSPAGKALVVLHEIAGLGEYLRGIMIRNGAVNYLRPVTPRLLALVDPGPIGGWPVLTHQQAAAWEEMLRETVTVQVRKHLRAGDVAPWPWPPRKDGTISPAMATEEDLNVLASEGER